MKFISLSLVGALVALLASGGIVQAADDAPSIVKRPDAFFTSEEGKHAVDNMLSWQGVGPGGVQGWPKAYNLTKSRQEDPRKLEWDGIATIDNGATYSELRILARAITLEAAGPRQETWKAAFYKGLEAVIASQYGNGGWPQRFPPDAPNQTDYARHITFNDNSMVRLMVEIKEIAAGTAPYAFVDSDRRKKAQQAFDKGIECILNCQIVAGGKLTGWCAQHDEITLKPAQGRAYELPSISGMEGAEIAVLLMELEHPDDRVKKAIEAAHVWFDAVKIADMKSVSAVGEDGKKDRVLEQTPGSTVWARFYDIETNKPIFAGRDSTPRESMSDIERERRTGYSWYGAWGQKVAKEYVKWKKRVG